MKLWLWPKAEKAPSVERLMQQQIEQLSLRVIILEHTLSIIAEGPGLTPGVSNPTARHYQDLAKEALKK